MFDLLSLESQIIDETCIHFSSVKTLPLIVFFLKTGLMASVGPRAGMEVVSSLALCWENTSR